MTQIRPIPDRSWEDEAPEVGPDDWEVGEEVPESAMGELLGGPAATMGAAGDDGQGLARVWEEAGRKLKEAIFGHPDRAEAEAAGVYTQPTPAKMVETGLVGAGFMAGGGAAGAATTRGASLAGRGLSMAGRILKDPLVRSIAAGEAARRAGELAESYGAPRGTASVAGTAGALLGGRGRSASQPGAPSPAQQVFTSDGPRQVINTAGRRGLPAQPPGSHAVPNAPVRQGNVVQMPQAPSPAQAQADEIRQKIVMWRKERGQSGAQITASLRELFGIPPRDGQKMVNEVFEAYGLGKGK